ncbi:MAG TPA: glycosyltransferase family 1 protein [Caulobacteraceae bacterium]|jgi:glycosyltransferase involved in cell wall biosynthesis
MPRVCIDGFNLGMPKGSGIATYARNLLGGLNQLGCETQILFASARDAASDDLTNLIDLVDAPPSEVRGKALSIVRRVIPRRKPVAWRVARSPQVLTREVETRFPPADIWWAARDIFHSANRAHAVLGRFTPLELGDTPSTDLMHWTCPLPLFEPRIPNVYTIHDLVPLRLPYATLENKRAFLDLCRQITSRAARILTVSEQSKQDIVRLLGIAEDRVVNTYQSVDLPPALTEDPEEEVAERLSSALNLDWRKYYLFYGALEPKKNISRIIEAYLTSGVSSPLVIVGGHAWLNAGLKNLLKPDVIQRQVLRDGVLVHADRVREYDFLPLALLVDLVRGARATLFPSLYEGFGLPVLESMVLGTPVLTSDDGALAEVVGDAALRVDPYDARAIRRGIQALDSDEGLRTDLITRGRHRAKMFSHAAYVERLRQAYEGLV